MWWAVKDSSRSGEGGREDDHTVRGGVCDPGGKYRGCFTRKEGRTALQVVLQKVESFAEYAAVFLDPL